MSDRFDPGDAKDSTARMLEANAKRWQEAQAEVAERIKHQEAVDAAVLSAARSNRQLLWLTVAILIVGLAALGVGVATLVRA
jgi:hypothetical protein